MHNDMPAAEDVEDVPSSDAMLPEAKHDTVNSDDRVHESATPRAPRSSLCRAGAE